MAITNIFNRRQRQTLNTSVDDDFLTQRGNKDNSEVPPSIQLSQSEDESSAKLNSDEDKPPTSSTKSNSGEDKPPTPLKKKGPTDKFARDCRLGFKELGDKVGKNLKEGMLVASEKVKEGVKETGEKAGDKVKEGLKDMSIKITISNSPGLKLIVAISLIINFAW
eukprot:CAMPEP_0170950596 /NCGR_PEP_ID=MMETSP0735-20130129/30076_1 /TAXON_ID=186038 /ORGANISM="Fragilariopsis kerguelensis, Strain L26-C5" /LENGTH=164 /DNA_ID=CAMNT_0011361103 /DNA_START=327 /DNA_END=818 /DNA_ORIENTATION=-